MFGKELHGTIEAGCFYYVEESPKPDPEFKSEFSKVHLYYLIKKKDPP